MDSYRSFSVKNDLAHVLTLLHDAVIEHCEVNKGDLHVRIDAAFLAQHIQPGFKFIRIVLCQIKKFELSAWTEPVVLISALEKINELFIEILSAKSDGDFVQVTCGRIDDEIPGGDLFIQCSGFELYTEDNNVLNIETLETAHRDFWRSLK